MTPRCSPIGEVFSVLVGWQHPRKIGEGLPFSVELFLQETEELVTIRRSLPSGGRCKHVRIELRDLGDTSGVIREIGVGTL